MSRNSYPTAPAVRSKKRIESELNAKLVRGWHTDGPGPARYGWASVHPCRVRYLGRTLEIVSREMDSMGVR